MHLFTFENLWNRDVSYKLWYLTLQSSGGRVGIAVVTTCGIFVKRPVRLTVQSPSLAKIPFKALGGGLVMSWASVKVTTVKYLNLNLLRSCIYYKFLHVRWCWSSHRNFLEPDKGNLSWGTFTFDLMWFSVIPVYSSVTAKCVSIETASRNTPTPHCANSASWNEETARGPITIWMFLMTPSTRSMWAAEEKQDLKWPFPSYLEKVDALPHTESTSQVEIR